jgi:hypothetical protein
MPADRPPGTRGEVAGLTGRSLSWVAMAVASETASDGVISFIASTGEVDRMSDSIDQASWVLGPYERNGVFLADHDGTKVIGRGKAAIVDSSEGKRLQLDVTFDDSDVNPLGKLIAHQHRSGFRNAVSVGFLPGRAVSRRDLPKDHPLHDPGDGPRWMSGYLYESPELLEVSSVGIPANRSALQLDHVLESHQRGSQYLPAAWLRDITEATGAKRKGLLMDELRDPAFRRAFEAFLLSFPSSTKATNSPPDPFGGWVRSSS